jgi:proline dehydrogenase
MFGHFCAGEDQARIRPVLKKLDESGIGGILDYAAESDGSPEPESVDGLTENSFAPRKVREYDYEDESQCDKHVDVFKKCIHDVADAGSKDGFAAIKVTALGNPKLLARMSQAIVEAKKLFEIFDTSMNGYVSREEFEQAYSLFFNDGEASVKAIFEEFDPNLTGNVDYITWSMNLAPKDLHKITANCREVGPLALATPTEEEIELIEAMFDRGRVLANEAAKVGTRLLIDAEQVRFQPAIDSLVLDLQQTFNATSVTDKPIIYNTYQCYLTDSAERLRTDVERSDRFDYHFGAKLVRGAYMESERVFAAASGLASPIFDTIEETHKSYDDSIDFLLGHHTQSDKQVEVMCATHNQASIENAIEAMSKHGIDRRSSAISFAQLYGMTDHLTFNLGKHGYRAYKYVPYGEVHEVMAYLLRRARENSAIVGGAAGELSMIKNELRRRLRSPIQLGSP